MSGSEGSAQRVAMLLRYKAWANELTFGAVMALPQGEVTKARPTRFGNMIHTLNHVYVIDRIFQAHLEGRPHGYAARNTDQPPPIDELWAAAQELDRWYVAFADGLSERQLGEVVKFEFVGGGSGAMTREEIFLHVVNHGTYHRGFVGDMLYQVPAIPPANDLPVFLRDAYQRPVVS